MTIIICHKANKNKQTIVVRVAQFIRYLLYAQAAYEAWSPTQSISGVSISRGAGELKSITFSHIRRSPSCIRYISIFARRNASNGS